MEPSKRTILSPARAPGSSNHLLGGTPGQATTWRAGLEAATYVLPYLLKCLDRDDFAEAVRRAVTIREDTAVIAKWRGGDGTISDVEAYLPRDLPRIVHLQPPMRDSLVGGVEIWIRTWQDRSHNPIGQTAPTPQGRPRTRIAP